MSSQMDDRLSRIVADSLIMMIDDEPLNMEVLQVHLEAAGYSRFVSISDPRVAMKAIEKHVPDVLLLDIVMPEVSGLDIMQELQRRPALTGIPVIVLTSENDARTKLRALELGATDFLAKPLDPSELALRMRNTLGSRSWQLRHMRMDALTEVPNLVCLTSLLEREFGRLDSQDTSSVLASFNLNGFKVVNQSLGTAGGDAVLWAVRERLILHFGRNDPSLVETLSLSGDHTSCVARIGSDQFAVLMTSLEPDTMATEAASRVSRFLKSMAEPIVVEGQNVFISANAGLARLGHDACTPAELLTVTATAMNSSRDLGDNRCAFYATDMDVSARKRLTLENGLRSSLDGDELFLVYQPKVDVETGNLGGAEALARWNHPTLGLVSPVEFISLAEQNGMIVPIGRWVMHEACRQTKVWIDEGYTDFKIAVNVSSRQLQEPDFLDSIRAILDETGLAPAALVVELTENMIMDNAEANVAMLQSMRDIGVGLSIDDFGTGYSSLAYLQRFPIDQLKIDRSFVSEIVDSETASPIVNAIVSLAHDLGLSVVAEGVETPIQLDRLRLLGCEEFQGYLFSPPVVPDKFEKLLSVCANSIKKAA